MKISELKKGMVGTSPLLGRIEIKSVSKKYLKVRQLDFGDTICTLYFKDMNAPVDVLKLSID